ncbi:TPA: hypothetical protein N0F65_006656 [Lagenidium giganteum]|uniref:Protein kinase domain-containing protein n=1 Tax=Lagenidium giganteum TaxID=4803 RepID=A0AAV2YLU7_9STRA|nr:TPA: hypothetical protein N0F65_006656 [Lagenidium giganteum]
MHAEMGLFDFFKGRASAKRKSVNQPEDALSNAAATDASAMPSALPVQVKVKDAATTPAAQGAPPVSMDSVATTASMESTSSTYPEDIQLEIAPAVASGTNADGEPLGRIQNYDIIKDLGRGATALVQLGRKQGTEKELVALKVFKTSLLRKMREVKRVGRKMVVSTALDKVQVEIAIMKKLNHHNLLNLLEVYDDDSETLVLVLEYAPFGQIMNWNSAQRVYKPNRRFLATNPDGEDAFTEDELRSCFRQLLLGLEYLHENNICHRDLKPENILISDNGVCKIADFGVAHLFEDEKPMPGQESVDNNKSAAAAADAKRKGYLSSTAGTYAFMGPETLKGGEFCAYAADVWALGITLYALVFGKVPFFHTDVVELFDMIENDPIPFDGDNNNAISDELTALLTGLLERDPAQRLSIKQAKQLPWVLEGLDDEGRKEFLHVECEQVTVSEEEVANAVTRVMSFGGVVRLKIGVKGWMKKAQRSLEKRKAAEAAEKEQPETVDEDKLAATAVKTEVASVKEEESSNNQVEV